MALAPASTARGVARISQHVDCLMQPLRRRSLKDLARLASGDGVCLRSVGEHGDRCDHSPASMLRGNFAARLPPSFRRRSRPRGMTRPRLYPWFLASAFAAVIAIDQRVSACQRRALQA